MKHSSIRRRPVPDQVAGDPLQPGATALLPVPAGEPFSLEDCFLSGQIFRWRKVDGSWYGPLGRSALRLTAEAGGVRVEVAGAPVGVAEVYRFLALDAPAGRIQRAVSTDAAVRRAIGAFPGLRILRQEPWECLVSYLCSQWNNIPRIEGITERIARRWGVVRRLPAAGGEAVEVACFPSPEVLATATAADFRDCGLGYRCGYLAETARLVCDGAVDLDFLRRAAYPDALAALLSLPGVGRKVADCILLFSLDKWEAFPVDVWVRRFTHDLYPRAVERWLPDARARREKGLSALEYRALVSFAWERWGALAGWAQEYLFYAARRGVI